MACGLPDIQPVRRNDGAAAPLVILSAEHDMGEPFRERGADTERIGTSVPFDRYFVGYGFDYNFTPLMSHTYGTHEFMAAVKFGDTARRYRWLNTY